MGRFIAEGSWKIAYRVSLAILKLFEAELLSVDLEGIMTRLRPDNASRQLADVGLDELWEVALLPASLRDHGNSTTSTWPKIPDETTTDLACRRWKKRPLAAAVMG